LIFVDTSFWAALTARDDQRHHEAVELFRKHGSQPLVTSNHVRGETWTLLRRRRGHRSSTNFLHFIERTERLTVLFVSEEVEGQALRWLRRHDEREYSFVDATSFALMKSLRIKQALAFDGDFEAAGFVELRP
jgi:predicted nucleic acid-binding protein